MTDPRDTPPAPPARPRFQRASAPPAPVRAPVPAGQTDTAAHGPGGTLRLNKRMAELGLASRREADDWIARGWVSVDGQPAVMGMQVRPDARIEVNRQARGEQARRVTILLHKPVGIVSGQAEDGHQPAITLVQPDRRWSEDRARYFFHPSQRQSLVPAGRLDIDSTGLLVLTQDGRVARQLIGEDSGIEKEYLVRVSYQASAPSAAPQADAAAITENVQAVFPAERLALLRHGLSLDGQALRPARVEWQNPEQLRVVLTEGRKRQIRRMCEQVGLRVVGLKRVRIGQVMLGHLPQGQWRYLQPHERF